VTETSPFIEWVPYKLTLRPPTASAGGTWQQLDSYQRHLTALGMPDPTKATARRVAAEHVRDKAERYRVPQPMADKRITQRLAEGKMSAEEAAAHFANAPDAREAEATAQKVRNEMTEQMYELLRLAVQAIREHPWLDLLRPMAEDAVAKRDETRWTRAHAFAEWLRDPMVNVCALSVAMANTTQDSDWTNYAYGDGGRGLYSWQVANADPSHVTPGTPIHLPGGGYRIAFSFSRNVRMPSIDVIAEHAQMWDGAGLFSAEEVIANQTRTLADQDREIDALQAPAPEKPGRVMVS
jgi:hypothetical protein